ncbi:MAG: hypothetical protein KY396_06620, partial [Actinobacteria bacterium]|nr:hypothetical protein [Actinomycetota bacterium]
DAFKKAAGKQPAKPDVDMKSVGPLGSNNSPESFTPLRPTPETGKGIDSGRVSSPGEPDAFASADPEEGGEAKRV